MSADLIRIHPKNPPERDLLKVVEVLREGGIVIYPTDSVYGIGCDVTKARAVEKIAQYKGVKVEKANFSFIFNDMSELADYTAPLNKEIFKLLKHTLPGPFTFILNASNTVPKLFKNNKKTLGIRIPDNNIPRELVRLLGGPILTTSLHDEDELIDYTSDPELIYERFANWADIIIDGGYGNNVPSTVVDCTSGEPVVIRQGIGEI
ncbi:MAG: L-threonylcarbamoyladenylate synthase [Sphingobacteriales bacterium JAD_PAG50586_3]|nr:MAG: L-threonylcarbamoyladenylate synthase [Sphingobacteriales bacterium JAD_PAG50586_3]